MLLLGRQNQRTCQRLSRRSCLQIGASSVLGLSLPEWLRCRASAQVPVSASAKSVIVLWLWGGPAHLDTWDPKPVAPLDVRGPFSPIATRVPGLKITELFPKIAQVADKFAVIRSLRTGSSDHGVAGTIGLTGSMSGGVGLGGKALAGSARPATGSAVARALAGSSRSRGLPAFMVVGGKLHQGKKAIIGEGGGPLGALYDPFRLVYDPVKGTQIPALQLPKELTPERIGDRRTLIQAFAEAQRQTEHLHAAHAIDDYRALAFSMLTSPEALRVFDLRQESASCIDRYGRTRFGQSCLLARRLVERGVPFVQVNWSDHVEAEEDAGDGGWDHHYRNFQIMQDRHAPWLDQAYSTLIRDLDERGLLSSTAVVAVGEFGRSPKINDKAGRDHWEHCYSALVAGGGVRGGRVIGESDARGSYPHDYPLHPADIAATIYRCLGISSEQAATLGIGVEGKVIDQLF